MNERIKNPLGGWDRCWPAFRETFSELHGTHPEFLAVTRYLAGMIATDHPTRTRGMAVAPYRSHPNPVGRRTDEAILFLPIYPRTYCLGTTLRLAEGLHRARPRWRICLLDPPGNAAPLPEWVVAFGWPRLRRRIPRISFLPRALTQWREAVARIETHRDVKLAMAYKFGHWRRHLFRWILQYQWEIAAAGYWIERIGIRGVVTINDTVKPAAAFVAAALRGRVPSVVLQHGTPGPSSVPFMAGECWVWGETSRRSFVHFGADPTRLRLIGNLEVEQDGQKAEVKKPKAGRLNLLLMLQWRGAIGWHESFFRDVVDLCGGAVARASDEWRLTIRMHPNDGEDTVESMRQRLDSLSIDYVVAPRDRRVEQDTAGADAVTTINSSAVMHALEQGIPCSQILPFPVESRLGPPLLEAEDVIRDQTGLARWLDEVAGGRKASSAGEVLANRGEALRAATERLVTLVR